MTSGDEPEQQGNENQNPAPAQPTYTAVTVTEGKNPAEEGWYEEAGGVYTLTADTEPAEGKTYYTKD